MLPIHVREQPELALFAMSFTSSATAYAMSRLICAQNDSSKCGHLARFGHSCRAMPLASALRLTVLAVFLFATSPRLARAQAVPGFEIHGENDGLDLWLPKIERPDGEYTNGLRISLSRSVAPIWGHLIRSASQCTGRETAARRCLTTEFAIAQQMYTPLNAPNEPRPFDRPFAGWLHADVTANVISASRLRSFKLTTGFTGPATLAGDIQKAFHRAAGVTNGNGWRYQLGFSPAGSLTYVERLRVVLASPAGHTALDLLPSWSVQGGNSRSDAYGELVARAGFHIAHPWNPASRIREGSRSFGVWLYGGIRETVVAYDQTLDRDWVRNGSTYSVERIPWVNSYEFGVAVRRHSLMITLGGVCDAREYQTELASHPYGSLTVTMDHRLVH